MLEILILISLTKQIGAIVEKKGYNSRGYKIATVALWFGGEFFGAIVGSAFTGGGESLNCLLYFIALIGAGIGAGISFAIANSLNPMDPSLTLEDRTQPVFTPSPSMGTTPTIMLGVLWLLTNTVANVGWGLVYRLVNPNYEASLSTIGALVSGSATGLIAGTLQYALLALLVFPKRNRLSLALWIPISVVGWIMAMAGFNFLPIRSDTIYFLTYLVSGLEIGVLQWLFLQKYSKVAIWWIAISMLDWVLNWAVYQSPLLYNLPNPVVLNLVVGLVSWIPSSIAISFILGGTYLRPVEDQ